MPVSHTAVVPVTEIFALRWAVLRTGLPRETAVYPEDALPGAFHIAAYDESGTVTGCATFFPDLPPASDGGSPTAGGTTASDQAAPVYRFRGLGSAPHSRGQGFGAAALIAGLRECAARGAALVWCHGRTSATGFYEHMGFTRVGEEFILEPSGPHYDFITTDLLRG